MSKKKTHEEFLLELVRNNTWFNIGYFTLESFYVSAKKGIIVKTPYGLCKVSVENLIKGAKPHIKSAVDKQDYFLKMLIEKNKAYKEGRFKVTGKFNTVNEKIEIQDTFGICEPYALNLLKGVTPSIVSAINPTSYWLNMVYKKRGCNFDYSKVRYKGDNVKVEIGCLKHNIYFKQSPSAHYFQEQGCHICGKESSNGIDNKLNNKCIFYLLKCFSETECFYKIGHTMKTIKQRYNTVKRMPYKYSIEMVIEGSMTEVLQIEEYLKENLLQKRYKPKIHFNGAKTETFSVDCLQDIENKVNEVFYQEYWVEKIKNAEVEWINYMNIN